MLLVEGTIAASPAERVRLCVPLTTWKRVGMSGLADQEDYMLRTRRMWYLCAVNNPNDQSTVLSAFNGVRTFRLENKVKSVCERTKQNFNSQEGAAVSSDTGPVHPPLKVHQIAPFDLSLQPTHPYVPPAVKYSCVLTMSS